MMQLATLTTLSTTPRLRLNDGTTATGAAKTKTMSLFSSGIVQQSLDANGVNAVSAITLALEPILDKAINAIEIVTTSSVTP